MPNGKGALECWYCTHWEPADDKVYSEPNYGQGRCRHWEVDIPEQEPPRRYRICANFSANSFFEQHNRGMIERHGGNVDDLVRERMSRFGIDLKPGVLYAFHYNDPPGIREMMKLTGDETEAPGDE